LAPAKTIEEIVAALENKVDERGSPAKRTCPIGTIILQPTDERRKTGSHYTPRALTHPIVKEALKPVFNRLGDNATPDEVLDLKVCDPAMGSGAFLVETCRALGERLQTAWEIHKHLMPDEAKEDPEIFARREVAKRCLYGVDRNHMATDLAKLSLWLVTLSQDEDFTFLDHAFKTGDSLVGLSLDEISNVTWELTDDLKRPLFASAFAKRVQNSRDERRRIRNAPDNVTYEIQQARMTAADKELEAVRLGGDAVIAAFFAGKKAKERKEVLNKLQDQIALGSASGWDAAREMVEKLGKGEHPIKPFHWEIEFPEVFDGENSGFDSFVGNPPFAGKNTMTASNRDGFLDWLKVISPGSHGNADLVAHFFRRTFERLNPAGTLGLVATKTIGQGSTRESGLNKILQESDAIIYRANRRFKWPGDAEVVVSVVHIDKLGQNSCQVLLDGRPVERISAYLRSGSFDDTPATLGKNIGIAFQGSIVLGMGFVFDDKSIEKGAIPLDVMNELLKKDPRNEERIKPFLGGSEVNSHPSHENHRYVIDFENFALCRENDFDDWDRSNLSKSELLAKKITTETEKVPVAADWPDLLSIVKDKVKPGRDKQKRESNRLRWWLYAENRPGLVAAKKKVDSVVVTSAAAVTHHMMAKCPSGSVFSHKTIVFVNSDPEFFATLMSRVHEIWSGVFGTTFGSSDALTYNPTQVFQTFAFPESENGNSNLHRCGETYLTFRASVMMDTQLGLTKTYNRFHDRHDMNEDIIQLRNLHAKMDDVVLRAYGWDDLANMCKSGGEAEPRFLHDTDEPEFAYQKRYHWPAWFRDKVLAKLLELNKERAAAEIEAAKSKSGGKLKSSALQLETKGTLL